MVVVAILTTIALIILLLVWLGGRVKCRGCAHFNENFMVSYQGQGLYRFGYCQLLIHDCKVVDPDVERQCNDFEEKVDEKIPVDVTQPDTKVAEGDKRPRNPKVSIFGPGKGGK